MVTLQNALLCACARVCGCVRVCALTSLAIPDKGGAIVPAVCKTEQLNFTTTTNFLSELRVVSLQDAPEASQCVSE